MKGRVHFKIEYEEMTLSQLETLVQKITNTSFQIPGEERYVDVIFVGLSAFGDKK